MTNFVRGLRNVIACSLVSKSSRYRCTKHRTQQGSPLQQYHIEHLIQFRRVARWSRFCEIGVCPPRIIGLHLTNVDKCRTLFSHHVQCPTYSVHQPDVITFENVELHPSSCEVETGKLSRTRLLALQLASFSRKNLLERLFPPRLEWFT